MKFMKSKKRLALLATLAVALVAAVGAYAYWTSTGSGTGTSSVESISAADQWTFSNVSIATPANGFYPGASVEITGTVTNSSDAPLKLHDVVLDPSAGDQNSNAIDVANAAGTCVSADNFEVTGLTVDGTQDEEIAAGESDTFTGTVTMLDTAFNQNGCMGADLTVHLKVDNGSL